MSNAVYTAPAIDAVSPATWFDANQRYLCAEFGRIKALLQLRTGDSSDCVLDDPRRAIDEARTCVPGGAPALDFLEAAFVLTPFERDVLLLTAGVEMDSGIAGLCAAMGAGTGHGCATFGLALAALPGAHWSALLPGRPLRRWRLIELGLGSPLIANPLRVDERVLHYLAGVNELDPRLQPLMQAVPQGPLVAESQQRIASAVLHALRERSGAWPVVQLHGADADGQQEVAVSVAASCGCGLYAIRGEDLPRARGDCAALATLWTRESSLLGAALLVDMHGTPPDRAARDFVDSLAGPVFLTGRDPAACRRPSLEFAVEHPRAGERRRLWQMALGPTADALNKGLDVIASQYRISARAIGQVGESTREDLERCCDERTLLRAASRARPSSALGEVAQRIEPTAQWNGLVLPGPLLETLAEIAAQVRHRATVYDSWGLGADSARGLGITALFVGEAGTGKTMAAEALATELGLELYRIDLASVVSKYIGETEKNLRRVFEAAEDSGAILLFDEADALFGKRSDVKDSHDRYANMEVSYLLQRMESYCGLAILTTNMKSALDRAFQRRLRFVLQFPFPDAHQRERIWRTAFPAATPTAGLDFARLARANVSGGGIRNIAVNAAFRAAEAGEPVSMRHVIAATRSEYAKLEKQMTESEFRVWV